MRHELEETILELLARTPKLNTYEIQKSLKVHYSSVQKAVKRLSKKRVIEVEVESKARTGLTSKKYILSIKGLIEYFGSVRDESQITKVMENYGNYYPYPIFKKWSEIVKMFGKEHALDAFHISVTRTKTREFSAVYSRLNPYVKTKLAWMGEDDFIIHTLTCFLFACLSFIRFETADGKPLTISEITKDTELLNAIEITIKTELKILETEKEVITDIAKIYNVSV